MNDFSDMVNRAGVLDRTDVDDLSDSLPLQDFTASMLMLEGRFSKLEVCVCVCVCSRRVCPRGRHASQQPADCRMPGMT